MLRARPGRPAADGWSALEVLAHLRASVDTVAPRVYQILARDAPPLPAVGERRLAETVGDEGWPAAESLGAFALRRAELVAALRRHVPAAFVRIGEHEPAGTVTLWRVVRGLVDHGAEHLAQLAATLAPGG